MNMQAKAFSDKIAGAESPGVGCLAIIVVTYNSADVIGGLLDSLPAGLAGVGDVEVVIVDNDSRDGSPDIVKAHPIGARVISTGRNAGYSAAINAAEATIAPDRDILILNPDMRLEPGCGLALVRKLADLSVGMVVPKLFHEDGTLANSIRKEPSVMTSWSDSLLGTTLAGRLGMGELVLDPAIYEEGGNVDWATGAAMAIPARVRRSVGIWDESFFLYSEEVDYMQRIRNAGLRIVYDPGAHAMHIGGEYSRSARLSALMTANRIIYFGRHHGAFATFMFRLGIIVGEAMRFALGEGHRAALGAALRPAGKYQAALQH